MGSGGSNALSSSSKLVDVVRDVLRRHAQLNSLLEFVLNQLLLTQFFASQLTYAQPKLLRRYMAKPHGQLVQVSSTPHNAYTPCLSTS